MRENYQPIVLRKILLTKGATRAEIEQELRKYNPNSTSQSMTDTVLTILQNERNNMIRKEGNVFVINSSHELSSTEINELISECEKKINENESGEKLNEITFKEAAIKILEDSDQPLHYTEITKRAIQNGLITTTGKTPEFSLLRDISEDIRINQNESIFKKIDDGIYTLNTNNFRRFFIALGPWSNWEHTINNPPFRWGVNPSSASNVGVFNALRPGDIVYYYSNQDKPTPFSKRGLFGVGTVISKYDEKNERYWPDEKIKDEIIYKHRFEINSLKLVKSDSELLPWIDGLPFTKGLNRIANEDTLKQLISNTEELWGIKLSEKDSNELKNSQVKYVLLRHSSTHSNQWRDDIGKKYHFGVAANYTKLVPGTKTIWFDRKLSHDYYWGYGEISRIEEVPGNNFNAIFDRFHYFNEPTKENPGTEDIIPKKGSQSVKDKIMKLPGWNNQNSILEITKDIYDEIINNKESSLGLTTKTFEDEKLSLLTPSEIKTGYTKISDELLISKEKIIEIITALASGRHVLLAGPIGTGKTRLAKMIPEIFWEKVGGYFSEDHTATSDWSTQDVIGGIYPKMEDDKPVYDIQNGCVVDTVRKNWENDVDGGMRISTKTPLKVPPYKGTWLIIDEFNRADIDKAFGQLFTALRTRWLKIPTNKKGESYKSLKIPEDYRIIGTLNTADKHFLFQLSDALKSRFAYIEIDIPKKSEFEKEIYYAMKNALDELDLDGFDKISLDHSNMKINREKSDKDFYNKVMQAYYFLDTVRVFKKLGTAILKLIYQNLIVGTIMTEDTKVSLDNALTSNIVPQLENLSITAVSAINAIHSDSLLSYIQEAYKNPNRQSYVESIEKILDYLEINNKPRFVIDFTNGNLKVENDQTWKPIQNAYDEKKKVFELELRQMHQSMNDLIKSMVI